MSQLQPSTLVLIAALISFLARPASAASAQSSTPPPTACTSDEYRAFDFWIGDWDVVEVSAPATKVDHTRVDSILNGCVLHEDYRQEDGMHGESFSIYDSSRGVWHQSWVTNRGKLLIIEGKMQSGQMVLSGTDRTADGKREMVRGTWQRAEGGVRETAVTSIDDGKTWTPWFDLMFRPADNRVSTSKDSSNDQEVIAALDAEFQAAVKKNDADTMARLLADDFILVTGSGKHFTKPDLVDEARSGRIVYTHQEDTDRTVHVWGDSAVVTAKLWEQGTDGGRPFDYTVWFSDTYVRTTGGWRYVFGQSSLPLPSAK